MPERKGLRIEPMRCWQRFQGMARSAKKKGEEDEGEEGRGDDRPTYLEQTGTSEGAGQRRSELRRMQMCRVAPNTLAVRGAVRFVVRVECRQC